ncbi:hypothetical protein BFJ71_g15490 [Fusarium oxysporum]|nr:hypothetical protein BFJ71_g15490 [Fusarium oxysporum]
MAIIAVAGGAGKVGCAIVEAIVEQGQHEVVVLSREAKDVKGAKVVAVDYTDTGRLTEQLETNKIEIVISIINSLGEVSAELSLIQAAEKSASTKRYIPSIWETKYTPNRYPRVVGYFVDYWVTPKVKSYQDPLPLVVGIANNYAAVPGSGDELVAFSHTFDVARFVAALVEAPKWEEESYIIGDKVSWNQFVQYAEEAKGVKSTVKNDSLELLKKGEITELPSPAPVPVPTQGDPAEIVCGFWAHVCGGSV